MNFPGFKVTLSVLSFPESSFWRVLKIGAICLLFPSSGTSPNL